MEIVLSPGSARYDATLKYSGGEWAVEEGGVSRISRYAGQAECMPDTTLRQWCYCPTS